MCWAYGTVDGMQTEKRNSVSVSYLLWISVKRRMQMPFGINRHPDYEKYTKKGEGFVR